MSDNQERRTFGTLRRRGRIWYLRYRIDGQEHWESTGSTSQRKAEKLLGDREREYGRGELVAPRTKRVTFDDLANAVRTDYWLNNRRSADTLEESLMRLRAYFGNCRASAITTTRVKEYAVERLDQGFARATVNKDLAQLRRGFNLAIEDGLLTVKPKIATPKPKNERSGFFERDDFDRVLAELPEPLRAPMLFAYLTGWRTHSEVLALTWDQVDFDAGIIRLEPNTTKNDEGRTFPFDVFPELKTLLEQQRAYTRTVERRESQIVTWVFHRNGRPIKSYADGWKAACRRAAIERRQGKDVIVRPHLLHRIPHDLRRTACRNLVRAGVSEKRAMALTGHKTRDVFDRYNIVTEDDLRDDVAKLALLHA